MRFHITVCCLISGVMLTGCTRPPESKSLPPLPVASGEIIRAVFPERILPADGTLTNYASKARTLNEGRVAIYDSGLVIITDPDGTKHVLQHYQFIELSFR